MKRFLIAADSFKGALDAHSVCSAIQRGIRTGAPDSRVFIFPLSDGGDGLLDVLDYHLTLKIKTLKVADPLRRPVRARYGLSHDGATAYIETAQAAGLSLLTAAERNPLLTSTFGVGELIRAALRRGARRIVLGLGGSATSDGGAGMAAALGWRFLNAAGDPIQPVGGNLEQIARILPPEQPVGEGVGIEIWTDVTNPLLGDLGAARVYAPQKGADSDAVERLELGLQRLADVAAPYGVDPAAPGMGAAGGLGFGCRLFLNAAVRRGVDRLMDLTGFDVVLADSDFILTGEGRLDEQTGNGKVVAGLIARAHGKPVVALCGALRASTDYIQGLGLRAAFSISPGPMTLEEAIAVTEENLEKVAAEVARLLAGV